MRDLWPIHLLFLNVVILIIWSEKYTLWSSSWCNTRHLILLHRSCVQKLSSELRLLVRINTMPLKYTPNDYQMELQKWDPTARGNALPSPRRHSESASLADIVVVVVSAWEAATPVSRWQVLQDCSNMSKIWKLPLLNVADKYETHSSEENSHTHTHKKKWRRSDNVI
jgi:hypothetical protein